MNKYILRSIIFLYVLFMLTLPFIYLLSHNKGKQADFILGLDFQNSRFIVRGTPSALNNIIYNKTKLSLNSEKNIVSTGKFKFNENKAQHFKITNQDNQKLNINFELFPKRETKKIMQVQGKFDVNSPRIEINNKRQHLTATNGLDTIFKIEHETETYIHIRYKTIPIHKKILKKLSIFTTLIHQAANRGSNIIINIPKFVSNVISGIFNFFHDLNKSTHLNKESSAADPIFFPIQPVIKKGITNLKTNFGEDLKYIYNTTIIIKNGFKKTINYILIDRKKNSLKKKITINKLYQDKNYRVNSIANLRFSFTDGNNMFAVNEKIIIDIPEELKKEGFWLPRGNIYKTDSNGEVVISLKFGKSIGTKTIKLKIRSKVFKLDFKVIPDTNYKIRNLNDNVVISDFIGEYLEKIFEMQIFDSVGNAVNDIMIELWENSEEGLKKYAEKRSNAKGIVRFNYRMPDLAEKLFIEAKIKDNEAKMIYTVDPKAKYPEKIELLDDQESQAIIGIPLKKEFRVVVSDRFDNPVSNIKVDFNFVGEEGIIASKSNRTNKSGIAKVKFDTPTKAGEYQVIAESASLPGYETGYNVLVLPGSATKIKIIAGNNQVIEWEKQAKVPLRFQVLDSLANPIPEALVKWKVPKEIELIEFEKETDADGMAAADIKIKKTNKKELYIIGKIGKNKAIFKIIPKKPSEYKLYLTTSPIVKVYADQKLPEDIIFVLKDQYNNILPKKPVVFQYRVLKKGLFYEQELKALTNTSGIVSINFQVSDQSDFIDFKAIYTDNKNKDNITWVKIEVLPENISLINLNHTIATTNVGKKTEQIFKLFIGDSNKRPIPNITVDIIPVRGSPGQLQQPFIVKTNKNGRAMFKLAVGEKKGKYIFEARLKKLAKRITINALPENTNEIKILKSVKGSYAAGASIKNIKFAAYDKYKNLITNRNFYYIVTQKNKIKKHKFNQTVTIPSDGLGRFNFNVPEKEGKYNLIIADSSFDYSLVIPIKSKATKIYSILLLKPVDGSLKYTVNSKINDAFPILALDRYGNALNKHKIALSLYDLDSKKLVYTIETKTNQKGNADFDFVFPKKSGLYLAKLYSKKYPEIQKTITINLKADDIHKIKIIAGDNQIVNSGFKFKQNFVLLAEDFYGNPVINSEIRWIYDIYYKGDISKKIITNKTDINGIATYNFITDEEPGIREIKAYYAKGKKWEHISFYVKILSHLNTKIIKLAGDNQNVRPTSPLADHLIVKLVDNYGSPIADMPIIFDISFIGSKGKQKLSPLTSYSDKKGISRVKLVAPLQLGEYEVKVYTKQNDSKFVVFKFFVTEKNKINLKQDTRTQKLISLGNKKITLSIKDNSKIEKIKLINLLGEPLKNQLIKWELIDLKTNKIYNYKAQTNSNGTVSFPAFNTSYERDLILKATDPQTNESIVFTVKVTKQADLLDLNSKDNYQSIFIDKPIETKSATKIFHSTGGIQKELKQAYLHKKRILENINIKLESDKTTVPTLDTIIMFTDGKKLSLTFENFATSNKTIYINLKSLKISKELYIEPNSKKVFAILPSQEDAIDKVIISEKKKGLFKSKKELWKIDIKTINPLNYAFRVITNPNLFGIIDERIEIKFKLISNQETYIPVYSVIRKIIKGKTIVLNKQSFVIKTNALQTFETIIKEAGKYTIEFIPIFSGQRLKYKLNINDSGRVSMF